MRKEELKQEKKVDIERDKIGYHTTVVLAKSRSKRLEEGGVG